MNANDEEALIQRLKQGGETTLAELCSHYEDRLRRMVTFRLDRRLLGRVDESDVLQETYLEAAKRIRNFLDGVTPEFQ